VSTLLQDSDRRFYRRSNPHR